jgi:glycosyltransferase involved in cell wall biosynthesis
LAFSNLPEKNIVCVGNWLNNDYGKNLKKEYENNKNIFLLDPIYDQKTLNQFRSNCSLYVHGHSAGGTNPSLVEAMYLKLPIYAFGINYNRETTANKAAYFNDVNELVLLIKNQDEDTLSSIAKNMQTIAMERYTWSSVCNKYSNLFSNKNSTK